ncbi:hypothetical protein FH972_026351 [Carpinus fangiana]|uniref:DUF7704 domain-containing protein n=1 Tax=Carpinus fangiana TaxID=176857 RepID=A0A5N6L3Q6_9ROSI|nr:hypothetical protein FH972_026351 [Carpinus fangiana]
MARQRVPVFYRILFLYIDPLLALSGIYFCLFDQPAYLLAQTPSFVQPSTLSPTYKPDAQLTFLLTIIGFLFAMMVTLQVVLLQASLHFADAASTRTVWRSVQFAILWTDVGLFWASYKADLPGLLNTDAWTEFRWPQCQPSKGVKAPAKPELVHTKTIANRLPKTYNTGASHLVTHGTTDPAVCFTLIRCRFRLTQSQPPTIAIDDVKAQHVVQEKISSYHLAQMKASSHGIGLRLLGNLRGHRIMNSIQGGNLPLARARSIGVEQQLLGSRDAQQDRIRKPKDSVLEKALHRRRMSAPMFKVAEVMEAMEKMSALYQKAFVTQDEEARRARSVVFRALSNTLIVVLDHLETMKRSEKAWRASTARLAILAIARGRGAGVAAARVEKSCAIGIAKTLNSPPEASENNIPPRYRLKTSYDMEKEAHADRPKYDEHPPLFLEWAGEMNKAEQNVHPDDRVYLVVSQLRKVRKAKGRLGFLENLGSTINDLAGGSINATKSSFASTRDSSSSAGQNVSAGLDEISQDMADAWNSLSLFLKLRSRPSRTSGTEGSSSSSKLSALSDKDRKRSSETISRSSSRHGDSQQSRSKLRTSPHNRLQEGSEATDQVRDQEPTDILCTPETNVDWRERLGLSRLPDYHEQDQVYWAKQPARQYKDSTSSFPKRTNGIAQCHWAVEYRGRYFELQVRKLPHAYRLKEFAFFNSSSYIEDDNREILARVYAGCSHMSCEVVDEIGKGIMKTQPVYELRSDNCQQFIAVFLPRILCARHPYMPCLPCGSVKWAQKYTTYPTFVVGVRQGALTTIDHRYYTITTGLNMLIKHLEKTKGTERRDLLGAWRGKPQVDFQSTEISTYTFRLQGDDPSAFQTCRPVEDNPYLLVHREHKKTDLRPLGNLEMTENDFHLWPKNKGLNKNPLLDQLRQADAIQNGKKLLGSLDRFKSQLLSDLKNSAANND